MPEFTLRFLGDTWPQLEEEFQQRTECNPNGEWGWLTECIDVPIADALAELLLRKSAL